MSNIISVGPFVLHRGVYWSDRFSEALISEEEFQDIFGGNCVQRMPIEGGRPITFLAEGSDSGGRAFFTHSFIEYIESLELSSAVVDLVYGNFQTKVRVPSNPLDVTPLKKMVGDTPGDIYYGSIKFKEVV